MIFYSYIVHKPDFFYKTVSGVYAEKMNERILGIEA